jgi:RecJ-like exonuclease
MNDEGYLFTECDYCGEEQEERGATALICEDCDGEGWVLAEDICDDECCASPQEDFPAYLCPSCDGHGME